MQNEKQKAELAERMMFERQIQVCSSFYKNMKEELENFVKTQSFDFSEREGVLHYVSKQPVGMCMNGDEVSLVGSYKSEFYKYDNKNVKKQIMLAESIIANIVESDSQSNSSAEDDLQLPY